MAKQTVRDYPVERKRVLVRVDYNVPLDPTTHEVLDDSRIRATLPTIQYLLERNAKVILISHLGRPGGKVVEALRLDPVARRLEQLLGRPVRKLNDCVGPEVEDAVRTMQPGEVILLENVRFHPEEEENDPAFCRDLASLAEVFVNDAFATAHRAHASTAGVAEYLPAVAGLLMERELTFLGNLLTSPQHPFVAIIGGAKVSTKIGVLRALLRKVDRLLIGGGMATTFFLAEGKAIGASLAEPEAVDQARAIQAAAQEAGVMLLLPSDAVIADAVAPGATTRVVRLEEGVPAGWHIVDIGPETLAQFTAALTDAKTVFWNGPLGVFEIPAFAEGTRALAQALARLPATTVVGGGETVAVVEQLGLVDAFRHVSTGGGAALEFLEGRELPGVACLHEKMPERT
ncbi:MAG: phosphoglycerate kinase [Dehalococcoidia bacterium]|nr:MAG: phosphoglycerate kinase [Dehalococcoidia bacterium]